MDDRRDGGDGYAVHIRVQPSGYAWTVTAADGRSASGSAPSRASADRCCDLTVASLEALRRVGRRRF